MSRAKYRIGKILSCLLLLGILLPRPLLATGSAVAYSERGMVVSCDQLASEAGATAMAEGGNAVDGAVTTAFALAVTCPRAGNLAGGGFAVIHLPNGQVITNDHREKAPATAKPDMFLDADGNHLPALSLASHLAVGVPGTVAGLLDMLDRYGKLKRRRVLAPAIQLAKKGFPLSYELAKELERRLKFFKKYPASLSVFSSDGEPYQMGDLFRQPDLARTLERIAKSGTKGFYQGETATLLVEEMQRGGGLITRADLKNYQSVWRDPVQGTYRDYEISSMGPPSSGGILLIQMLNMLEMVSVAELGFGSVDLLHYMIEVERRAYAGRNMADPDFYQTPVERLLSKGFAKERLADVSPDKASRSSDVTEGPVPVRIRPESTETTHISVLDSDGWAVSLTTTLNSSYGTKIVVAGAGMLLNNEMDDFASKQGAANLYGLTGRKFNAIEPHKRMLSSMTPTIVSKDGKPFLVLGAPGGSTIITSVMQVIINLVDHGMKLDQAIQAPRFHHQWMPDRVLTEPWALSADTLRALRARGHLEFITRPARFANRHIGVVNAIIQLDDVMMGVPDPRRPGAAVGF